ncbi:hypothetical protein MAGR_18220 [Mycolicibacterium agri]|uniref:Guanylate cyclase domain-containing protein n=1 Tax=Mycolicibacterium agri TaxID=36811 RepID=A0A7I9VY56_MYCAG|nr:hypothetical protein MAGR_18220 [Mycolicibacterium agri]
MHAAEVGHPAAHAGLSAVSAAFDARGRQLAWYDATERGAIVEFTLIGDAVNVAARVEQLTKTTKDTILLTKETASALGDHRWPLADRGPHALKGKSAAVQILALRVGLQ